jgi:hypothetical protein
MNFVFILNAIRQYSYVTVPFVSSHLSCRRLQEVRKSTHPDGLTSNVTVLNRLRFKLSLL